MWGLFINHYKDSRIPLKQAGYHGKYPRVFFMADLRSLGCCRGKYPPIRPAAGNSQRLNHHPSPPPQSLILIFSGVLTTIHPLPPPIIPKNQAIFFLGGFKGGIGIPMDFFFRENATQKSSDFSSPGAADHFEEVWGTSVSPRFSHLQNTLGSRCHHFNMVLPFGSFKMMMNPYTKNGETW